MRRFLITCITCVLALGAAAALPAQDPPAPGTVQDSVADSAAIQARIDAAKADDGLAADARTALLEVFNRALDAARAAEANTAAAADWSARARRAPDDLREAQRRLEALHSPEAPPPGAALADLEQGLAARQQQQTNAANAGAELDAEARKRAERRSSAPPALADLKKQLEALPERPPEVPGVGQRLQEARRVLRLAERNRLRSQIDSLTAEVAAYDAEDDLLRARRDLEARRATAAKAEVEAWQAALQRARSAAAQSAANAAQAQVGQTDPRIVSLAEGNVRLAGQAKALTAQLAAAEVDRTSSGDDLRRLEEEFGEIQERARLVGSTDEFGVLLRKQRSGLNDRVRAAQQWSRNRGESISSLWLQKLSVDDRLRAVVRRLPRDWLQRELGAEVAVDSLPATVIDQAEQLRKKRQELLTQLSTDYGQLINTLKRLESDERDFVATAAEYRTFLTERVLGIRSSAPIWNLDPAAAGSALLWLIDATAWLELGRVVATGLIGELWPIGVLLALLALLLLAPWLGRRLQQHGEVALRGTNIAYAPTALAMIDSCLIAAAVPALLWFVSLSVAARGEASEFAKAIAAGATSSAGLLAVVGLMRTLVRHRGLGEAHFRWQTTTLRLLRSNLRLLLPVAFPIAFVLGALEAHGDEAWLGSLGGLSLLAMSAVLLVVAWRTLHPVTGLIGGAMKRRTAALYRFRSVWFLLGVGTAATLLVMSALGYDYTALQLARRLLYTVAVVVLGVLVQAFVLRGLVLERRRLQIRQAQERIAAQKSADATTTVGESLPLEEIDPQSLARQTQTLVHGAITIVVLIVAYRIWVDVLPALGTLRRVDLWPIDGGVAGTEWIHLSDVLLSLFVLFAAIVAGRNVPALLELLVLQRLRMLPGERTAVTTLTRYGIVIVGVVLAFNAIGIGWSKVQWLIAAVSVGLGFGLQEIFANFVSGLILLLERPIRVGDLVSVGNVIGRVTRIRIRATTIQDWDRKELVVPNREFVTSHFVNWTLTDSFVRWVIPVGIAYGSDTQKALELLERAAAESKNVLRDPKPEAVFVKFGDSTLDLNLRVFVDMSALDWRWMTDLHQAIDRLFRAAGIEIAFPQRDVHLKVSGPLLEALQRGGDSKSETATSGATRD